MGPKAKKGTKKAQKGKQYDSSDGEGGNDLQSLNAKLGLKPLSDDSESEEEEAAPQPASKSKKKGAAGGGKGGVRSAFAALNMDDHEENDEDQDQPASKVPAPVQAAEESDDGEGLMAQMSKAAKAPAAAAPAPKEKKKKKGKKQQTSLSDDEALDAAVAEQDEPQADQQPAAVAADDLWPSDEEGKKPKKGKKGGKKAPEPAAGDGEEPAQAGGDPAAALDDGRPLSKKEKEKLKKQRQKDAEKAKKAKSKPATPQAQPSPSESPAPAAADAAPEEAVDEPAGDDDDAEAAGGAAASSKDKKKKKKKAGANKEAEAAPAAAPSGKAPKVSKAVAAMREAMAARQAAEEKQREAEEERLRKLKEDEEAEEQEKAKVEAARVAKKQKQKEKEAQQKASGTFKTPAQRKAEARAQAQREALLASGAIKVAGMGEGDATAAPAPKKPVYNNKKKGPQKPKPAEQEPEQAPAEPIVAEKKDEVAAAPAAPEEADDGIKDDWDAPSEEEKDDVKDAWDAESEEEQPKPEPTPAPAKAPAPTPAKAEPKKEAPAAKEAPKQQAAPAAKANGKKAPAPAAQKEESSSEEEESSSEENSDSEEDSDSDEDSSEEESSSEEDSSDDDGLTPGQRAVMQRKAEMAERKRQRQAAAKAAQSKDDLRSPICCILGHVDTGKTKLLDKIRQTNVQEGEAGGITQQIGATFFPTDKIKAKTQVLGEDDLKEYKLPGLLVIDTPGHESFTNLRTRGSSLCNIAILVVDIVHGLEQQTLESLRLLRDRKTPFVVALNKIDRIYNWKPIPNAGFKQSLASQAKNAKSEFEDRLQRTILEFAEQGLNAAPWYDNKDLGRTVSLVPTSAMTGEGIPDMLMLLMKLTQERMSNNLMYLSELECTVLEVKVIEGLGTTIDVVLSNGVLREGDRIVVCGLNGPIVTQVRALLTPQPLKELRIKGAYVHHKEVKAALGIKIVAPELEKAIAGSRLMQVTEDDDEEEMKQDIMQDLTSLLDSVDRSGKGVWVQSSTLGALEALLDFLKSSKIPVAGINIGPVHKKDITRASVMLDRAPEFAVCLCFDVTVDKDAEKLAEEFGIKIFKADIIYHLFDAFIDHNKKVLEAKQKDSVTQAVWPCRLKTLACFAKRDPIILGCDLIEGQLRVGTPLCVLRKNEEGQKEIISLGRVTSLEINHRPYQKVLRRDVGAGVAVKIEHAVYEPARMFGRHFEEKDEIISMLSRKSIDTLKELFRDDVSKDEWMLIKKLKPMLEID